MMRDDFPAQIKDVMAKRVGYECSNPACRQKTSGPHEDSNRAVNIGVAAHITAASPGGPRYDATMSPAQRSSVENGVWLCQNCGKLVDSDETTYTVESLKGWKATSEAMTRGELEQRRDFTVETTQKFRKAEQLMPVLLMEMRRDLAEYPVRREYVLLPNRRIAYWARGHELYWFQEEHDDLQSKLQVLENLGLIREITYNNVKRYLISEELADYLTTTTLAH